jgi:hypothetical protein
MLLTTAMGEAVSDFMVLEVNKYLGVVLGFAVFVAAMAWQFRTPHYRGGLHLRYGHGAR